MPFKKDRYPVDWPEIRARILQRDGNRCKFCRAPNGAWISRDKNFQWGIENGAYMVGETGAVFANDGTPLGFWRGFGMGGGQGSEGRSHGRPPRP
jgi:hypothetical protein